MAHKSVTHAIVFSLPYCDTTLVDQNNKALGEVPDSDAMSTPRRYTTLHHTPFSHLLHLASHTHDARTFSSYRIYRCTPYPHMSQVKDKKKKRV